MNDDILTFLARQHPYDRLSEARRREIAGQMTRANLATGDYVFRKDAPLDGLYVILDGQIRIEDETGTAVSLLERGNSFGERGLMRDGRAASSAIASAPADLLTLPAALFHELRDAEEEFRRFFDRSGDTVERRDRPPDLATVRVETLMARDPITAESSVSVQAAAELMRAHHISSLCITEGGRLAGLVTLRDLVGKVLARGGNPAAPVRSVMTAGPRVLPPTALGSDVLHVMLEHRLGHLPIVEGDALVGIVTQTDLTRFQAINSASLVADAAEAQSPTDLARITARIPRMLGNLVAAGHRHDVVTRMITDVADVVTRRLLRLAEDALGPPPGRFLWLACGSQGRKEQTGVSDQDNCLILEDGLPAEADAYFEKLAAFVSDGLDACGYVYCPGDMMATNPRWRQPLAVWRAYYAGWIKSPSKEAQMLASVMFDLRPIGGDESLFDGLQAETLAAAAKNSIFTAHMASNALTHGTPLGLLRDFATIRSGEHRDTIDMKMSGVVPVVDLGRMYALQGQLAVANTRVRLEEAVATGTVSPSGGRDLIDAYDLVAETRLRHQAAQIRRGEAPDNFLPPATLSDFERSHLRNAFVVIKTMQSALMQGRGLLG
ncbi:MAG: DUF294 nucleotidyltransferase-like domain-containing protein [Pseudomonadota bacterium]